MLYIYIHIELEQAHKHIVYAWWYSHRSFTRTTNIYIERDRELEQAHEHIIHAGCYSYRSFTRTTKICSFIGNINNHHKLSIRVQ